MVNSIVICDLNEKSEQVQQAMCLNVKHHCFIFQRIVQIHVNIYRITCRFDRMESTAAIVASVVKRTRRPGSSSSTTLSQPRAYFLHQNIVGLVKYLSPYPGCISDWMAFALSPSAHRKQITKGCSLWDDFNSNIAISNVYKWRRHSDVMVIKLTARIQN